MILLAACSNASEPKVDAAFVPVDGDDVEIDGSLDAPDATGTPALRILVLNEVAAGETPDWFEIVNATVDPVELSQYAYVDVAGDLSKAKPFPMMTLSPGAYYVQDVDDATSGFKLSSDEELWIYRIADYVLSDGVDWDEGAAAMGSSYARVPSIFGGFVTGAQSKGVTNP